MAKKILPGDMPTKKGTKRNGGAIPGKPKPGPKPDGAPKMPRKQPPRAPKPPATEPVPIGNPPNPAPTPGPSPKPTYKQFKNALNTPGMQAGEADALKRIQKNRGVNAKEATRIAKRRTAKGLPTARLQPRGS